MKTAMKTQPALTILTLIVLPLIISTFCPVLIHAQGAVSSIKSLTELINEFNQLPIYSEDIIPDLLPSYHENALRPSKDSGLTTRNGTDLESAMVSDMTEENITQRQQHLAEIFKQSIVEVSGADSAGILAELFFHGTFRSGRHVLTMPATLNNLKSPKSIYEFLYMLVQREPAVAQLALVILPVGLEKSYDTLGLRLAHYAAESTYSARAFYQVLGLYDRLNIIRDQSSSIRRAVTRQDGFGELTTRIFLMERSRLNVNPFLRNAMIENILGEYKNQSHHETTRIELIGSLAVIHEDARVQPIVKQLVTTSQDPAVIETIISGAGLQRDLKAFGILFEGLKNIAAVDLAHGTTKLTDMAIRALFYPIDRTGDKALRAAFMRLFDKVLAHPTPAVRMAAMKAVNDPFSDSRYRANRWAKFIVDADLEIRIYALKNSDSFIEAKKLGPYLQLVEQRINSATDTEEIDLLKSLRKRAVDNQAAKPARAAPGRVHVNEMANFLFPISDQVIDRMNAIQMCIGLFN